MSAGRNTRLGAPVLVGLVCLLALGTSIASPVAPASELAKNRIARALAPDDEAPASVVYGDRFSARSLISSETRAATWCGPTHATGARSSHGPPTSQESALRR